MLVKGKDDLQLLLYSPSAQAHNGATRLHTFIGNPAYIHRLACLV
jgi:hypothetical protein